MNWIKTADISIGDLVKISSISAVFSVGIVTEIHGREIMYVYWGSGNPKPINLRLVKVLR